MADPAPPTRPATGAITVARLTARADAALPLIERLSESFDAEDVAVGASEETRESWSIALYFRQRPNETAIRALVALAAGRQAGNALVFETVAPKDWVTASLAGLKPVQAGRFVVHGAHDRGRIAVNRTGIEIEAALAFGTGHHGTTRGCLFAFDALLRGGTPRRVLDIGTGTGVLAIAAARATRRPVLASDNDPVAIAVARANARLNRVGNRVAFLHAPGLSARRFREGRGYDLVFANILVGPLKLMAANAAALLAPGGRILLSGLLPEHANAAVVAYRMQGLALERRILFDNWVTLVMRRAKRNRPWAAMPRGDW